MRHIRIFPEPFEPAAAAAVLQKDRTDVGATVSFVGYCRDDGGMLEALELEHFPGMAEAEIDRIVATAERRWPLLGITVVHRTGLVRPGEPIVLVAIASRHRAAAFEAAAFIMDFLKTDAPFWKREHRRDTAADPRATSAWVGAKSDDDVARDRWAE